MNSLKEDTITFGKYKDGTISDMLKDRNYCKWLLKQEWFKNNYEYIYNRIIEYNPQSFFIKKYDGIFYDFIDSYIYFNMIPLDEIKLPLNEKEIICYKYYLSMLDTLKNKIIDRIDNSDDNIYDIKAPTKWLNIFENSCNMKRDDFRLFLNTYDLPNIPFIVEDIKKEGGIEYKGAKSFNIAKKNSEKQEKWWGNILKKKYSENISSQFKYKNCIFDFINISTNTIFECKLSLKDFNKEQYNKYLLTLDKYEIIYLVSYDTIININKKVIYTTSFNKYILYQKQIELMKNKSYLDAIIVNFKIINIDNVENLI
jgi:hypothetical protein